MTGDVVRWEDPGAPVAPGRALSLTEWATEAQAAYALAEVLCKSAFAPGPFRNNPVNGAAAILAGAELGLTPLASFASFDVIDSKAAPRALTLRALAQSAGHELILVTSTESRCVMRGRRRDSDTWQEVTWTIERARRMGLTGKRNWTLQPQAMLIARATGELARLVAADVLLGIPYSAEELRDEIDDAAPTRRVRRSTPPPRAVESPTAPEPGPHAPEAHPDEPGPQEAAHGPELADPAAIRALGALLIEIGLNTREERAAFVTETLGREVADAFSLTPDEVTQVITEAQVIAAGADLTPDDEAPPDDEAGQ